MDSNVLCHQVAGDLALNRRLLKEIEGQMSSFPAGSLCRKTIKGKHYYYQYLYRPVKQEEGYRPEKQHYLSAREAPIRSALAQKAFCRKALRLLQANIQAAELFLSSYVPYVPADLWAALPEAYIDDATALPVAVRKDDDPQIEAWLSQKPEFLPPYPEQLVYRSPAGLLVRSKSESLIASMLDSHGIPFRYEAPLALEEKTYFPDFTVMRRSDRQIIYWEHFGMMEDETYRQHTYSKLCHYTNNGILPFEKLIATYESQSRPFDAVHIDRIIRTLLV